MLFVDMPAGVLLPSSCFSFTKVTRHQNKALMQNGLFSIFTLRCPTHLVILLGSRLEDNKELYAKALHNTARGESFRYIPQRDTKLDLRWKSSTYY